MDRLKNTHCKIDIFSYSCCFTGRYACFLPFAFLKKLRWKKCPRRVLFAADYESRLFLFFSLLTVPMAPSWRRICDRYLASTRVCCSMQSASLQNVRFVEAKRLILFFALYTKLCYSFQKLFLCSEIVWKLAFLFIYGPAAEFPCSKLLWKLTFKFNNCLATAISKKKHICTGR